MVLPISPQFAMGITTICFTGLIFIGSFRNIKALRFIGYLGLAISTIIAYLLRIIDSISFIFSLSAVLVGFSAGMYVDVYEVKKYGVTILHLLIDLFAISIYATFMAPNIILFIVFWFLAEIVGFFTIVYEVRPETFTAGLRYLVVSMLPADLALLTLLASISFIGLTPALMLPIFDIPRVIVGEVAPYVSIILVLGFSAKAAIAPLHFWLPDAHSLAPAPASAILSGIMVKMGFYGILRVLAITESQITPIIFIIFGALSAIYGGLLALVQTDIKRILAYSTIENTGLMMIALMVYRIAYFPACFDAFIALLVAHALFKSSLFLNSGTIEVVTHTRDATKLGYLAYVAPKASVSALLSILSLMGVPPTIGFISKLLLISSMVSFASINIIGGTILLVSMVIAMALTIIYSIRYLAIYWGTWIKRGIKKELHEVDEVSLVRWELIPASLGVIMPLFLPLIRGTIITLEIAMPLGVAVAVFSLIIAYVYMQIRRSRRDYVWLGGEIP